MTSSQSRQYLAVVSAAVTELPASALMERRLLTQVVQNFLPPTSHEEIRQALTSTAAARDLYRNFCYADDAEAASFALALAAAIVDAEHYAARVFLDNLAEWLIIPPKVHRQILRDVMAVDASVAA